MSAMEVVISFYNTIDKFFFSLDKIFIVIPFYGATRLMSLIKNKNMQNSKL